MAVLTVTPITLGTRTAATIPLYAGVNSSDTPPYQAASIGGDSFANDGKTFFAVLTHGATPTTITIPCVKANDQGVTENIVSTSLVGAGSFKYFGPFDVEYFNDANGRVNVSYTSVTDMAVCPFSAGTPGRG